MAVHDSTVAQDDGGLLLLDSPLQEDILQAHLRLHDLNLKAYLVHECHLVRLNEAASLHHESGSLGHQEHLEALRGQVVCYSGQGRGFPSTGTPCEAHAVNWVLGGGQNLRVVQVNVHHALVC